MFKLQATTFHLSLIALPERQSVEETFWRGRGRRVSSPLEIDSTLVVAMSLMALIQLGIGIQIMWNGWAELNAIAQ